MWVSAYRHHLLELMEQVLRCNSHQPHCLPNQRSPLHPIVPQRLNPSIHAGSRAMRGVRYPVKRARPPNAGFWYLSEQKSSPVGLNSYPFVGTDPVAFYAGDRSSSFNVNSANVKPSESQNSTS